VCLKGRRSSSVWSSSTFAGGKHFFEGSKVLGKKIPAKDSEGKKLSDDDRKKKDGEALVAVSFVRGACSQRSGRNLEALKESIIQGIELPEK